MSRRTVEELVAHRTDTVIITLSLCVDDALLTATSANLRMFLGVLLDSRLILTPHVTRICFASTSPLCDVATPRNSILNLDAFKNPARLPLRTPNSREQRCTRRYLSKIPACLPPSNCAATLSMESYQAYW
ncbi:hypothetical protein J6590_083149 [Homalodisca vitripennis]|nr:hypothetical protein J6590_083149 [Homalodisca vitripennis]